jgi:NAD(P)-dependent dehydrogenase (short-subunit alcohol dehydrogenase family)/acyl carrier protein
VHLAVVTVGCAQVSADAAVDPVQAGWIGWARVLMTEHLGVRHVYSSRTLNYVQEVLRDTGSRGVDVLVNSLAAPHFARNFELMAVSGRFVELGKQDFAANTRLGLEPFNRAFTLVAVNLDRWVGEGFTDWLPHCKQVRADFLSGVVTPLPQDVFPASRAKEALVAFSKGEHIGRIVIDYREGAVEVERSPESLSIFLADRSYLFTGGLSGFGLATALWAARLGARHLVLASRRGSAASGADDACLDELRRLDVDVRLAAVDVTDRGSLAALLGSLSHPLDGVFHAAAVLRDEPLSAIGDGGGFDAVWRAKALGAWHLDALTHNLPLRHFVCYSSVSALVGNRHQGAYAAANAYMDCLMRRRAALGLAGLSVSWGAIGETGMVARDGATQSYLRSVGLSPIQPADALGTLGDVVQSCSGALGVIDADWRRWAEAMIDVPWARLAPLLDVDGGDEATTGLVAELRGLSPQEAGERIVSTLAALVCATIGLPLAEFELSKPLKEYGVDSMMAIDVQLQIKELTGVSFNTIELLSGKSVLSLAPQVLEHLSAKKACSFSAPAISAATALKASSTAPAAGAAVAPLVIKRPEDLRSHCLSVVDVSEPYFDYDRIVERGAELVGTFTCKVSIRAERGLPIAEATRHMAILGSYAVRRRLSADPGKVFFPMKAASMQWTGASSTPSGTFTVIARDLVVAPDARSGSASSQLLDAHGECVFTMHAAYHCMPAAKFVKRFELGGAFASRPPVVGSPYDPTAAFDELPIVAADGSDQGSPSWTLALGEVSIERCAGHFDEAPVYPVSIMLRPIFSLLGRVRAARGMPTEHFKSGVCKTVRMMHPGEQALIHATPSDARSLDAWHVNVSSEQGTAVSIELEVTS